MHPVKAFVDRAAAVRSGILIRGEDGTGRRVLARTIHDAHSTGSFVTVDYSTGRRRARIDKMFGASGAPVKSTASRIPEDWIGSVRTN